jgi:hypothetical protein
MHVILADESVCLLASNFQNEVVVIHRSRENAVPLNVDIPYTGRGGSDLSFKAVLQEDL